MSNISISYTNIAVIVSVRSQVWEFQFYAKCFSRFLYYFTLWSRVTDTDCRQHAECVAGQHTMSQAHQVNMLHCYNIIYKLLLRVNTTPMGWMSTCWGPAWCPGRVISAPWTTPPLSPPAPPAGCPGPGSRGGRAGRVRWEGQHKL